MTDAADLVSALERLIAQWRIERDHHWSMIRSPVSPAEWAEHEMALTYDRCARAVERILAVVRAPQESEAEKLKARIDASFNEE